MTKVTVYHFYNKLLQHQKQILQRIYHKSLSDEPLVMPEMYLVHGDFIQKLSRDEIEREVLLEFKKIVQYHFT